MVYCSYERRSTTHARHKNPNNGDRLYYDYDWDGRWCWVIVAEVFSTIKKPVTFRLPVDSDDVAVLVFDDQEYLVEPDDATDSDDPVHELPGRIRHPARNRGSVEMEGVTAVDHDDDEEQGHHQDDEGKLRGAGDQCVAIDHE